MKHLLYLAAVLLAAACSDSVKDSDPSARSAVPLADPFILLENDTYYAYGTHSREGIAVYTSTDLKTWQSAGLALSRENTWTERNFWAPEVYKVDGKYYMYFSANEHICVATASSPLGPFKQEVKRPMMEEPGIDNSLFIDDDGTPYLFFVRFDHGNHIWVAELEKDLQTLKPETFHPVVSPTQAWESHMGKITEGPFVIKHQGLYYLTYSGSHTKSPEYGVGCATATDIMGEWTKYPDGENPLISHPGELVGAGHHSFFKDKKGDLRIVYHAHFSREKPYPRSMYIGRAWFEKAGGGPDRIRIGQTYIAPEVKEDPVISLLAGTFTDAGSEGIYSYHFNQETGEVVPGGKARKEAPGAIGFTPIKHPTFMAVTGAHTVYAAQETGLGDAALFTYDYNPADGSFRLLGSQPSFGGSPCYVSTDGRNVLTADYSGGTLSVYPKEGEPWCLHGAIGGPDLTRQEKPHIHCALFSPDGKYIFASDFSADRLIRLSAAEKGPHADTVTFPLHPDYGPRHLLFDASGKHLYVIGELSGDVTVFDYKDGDLAFKQEVKADKADGRGGADIHLSPDGKFLYASLRKKNDGIAIFSVRKDGTLTEAGYQNTGIHPRNFNLTPNGKWLLCACRDSDAIEIYARDAETGLLENTGRKISLSKPMFVTWTD